MEKYFKRIEETGEWWTYSKFDSDKIKPENKITKDELATSLKILKSYFPATWAKESFNPLKVTNTFFCRLCEWIPMVDMREVLAAANMFKRMSTCDGFLRVLRDIKNGESSRTAWFELQMGYLLHRCGLQVEFPVPKPSKGKTPDIIGSYSGKSIAVECKDLRMANKNEQLEKYYSDMSQRITAHPDINKFGYEIYLAPPHLNDSGGVCSDNGILISNTEKTFKALLAAVNCESKNEFMIPDVGIGKIIEEGCSKQSIIYNGPSAYSSWQKILSNGIKKGTKQLAAYKVPGILLILSPDRPDLVDAQNDLIAEVMENPEEYKYTSAVFLIPRSNVLYHSPSYLLLNPNGKVNFYDLPGASNMAKELQAINIFNRYQC